MPSARRLRSCSPAATELGQQRLGLRAGGGRLDDGDLGGPGRRAERKESILHARATLPCGSSGRAARGPHVRCAAPKRTCDHAQPDLTLVPELWKNPNLSGHFRMRASPAGGKVVQREPLAVAAAAGESVRRRAVDVGQARRKGEWDRTGGLRTPSATRSSTTAWAAVTAAGSVALAASGPGTSRERRRRGH